MTEAMNPGFRKLHPIYIPLAIEHLNVGQRKILPDLLSLSDNKAVAQSSNPFLAEKGLDILRATTDLKQ